TIMLQNKLKIALAITLFTTINLTANEKYTMTQIYDKMCIECHSTDGSGNTDKLTPSMRDETLEDIIISLKEVENDNGHIIMNHNREKILEKGMDYSANEMAEYMFNRFKK
ncbi:MAG: cytochrome c, partial [Campylobacterota bacterium]|nr:cytochrome c [Campylobacterota bacterium]